MNVVDSLPISFQEGLWLSDGSVATLRESADGGTRLDRWSEGHEIYDTQYFDGNPLRILSAGERILLVTSVDGRPSFHFWVPSDDSDADGFPNAEDDFPVDAAASIDRDRDGAPDDWNPGMGADDSTQGLVLDTFPMDPACQLAEHAKAEDPDVCDVGRLIPDYEPEDVLVDQFGVLYLLSNEHDRVFRWSTAQNDHLLPIEVRDQPEFFALSDKYEQLYVIHAGCYANKIDLSSGDFHQVPIPMNQRPIWDMQMVGEFLLLMDLHFYSIRTPDGAKANGHSNGASSYAATWSDVNARVYALRDYQYGDTTSVVLASNRIDQNTGDVGARLTTPRVFDGSIVPPIRVSRDGTRLFLGSGVVYDALTLEVETALSIAPTDGLWLDDGEIVTIRPNGDGRTRLERWSVDLGIVDSQYFGGEPIAVKWILDRVVVVTQLDGQPQFGIYVVATDLDGGG